MAAGARLADGGDLERTQPSTVRTFSRPFWFVDGACLVHQCPPDHAKRTTHRSHLELNARWALEPGTGCARKRQYVSFDQASVLNKLYPRNS